LRTNQDRRKELTYGQENREVTGYVFSASEAFARYLARLKRSKTFLDGLKVAFVEMTVF
jgi:hypothetical protein